MAKYLIAANYTSTGLEGVRAKGAKSRVDAVASMLKGVGGSLESFFFAFGDVDVYAVAEVPDDEAAAAVAMAINSTGSVTVRTIKLLTADQVDEALRRSVDYHPPGS